MNIHSNKADNFTADQKAQIDTIQNAAFEAVAKVLGHPDLEWNMEWIGNVADAICQAAIQVSGKSEMEIYPFYEEKAELTTKQKYVEDSGSRCPFCGSENTNEFSFDLETGLINCCDDCGEVWQNQYSLKLIGLKEP